MALNIGIQHWRSTLVNIDIQHWHSTLAFDIGIRHWHSTLAFSIGIRHWHSILAFNIGIQQWHSSLLFNIGIRHQHSIDGGGCWGGVTPPTAAAVHSNEQGGVNPGRRRLAFGGVTPPQHDSHTYEFQVRILPVSGLEAAC